jgi:hypothetical protein
MNTGMPRGSGPYEFREPEQEPRIDWGNLGVFSIVLVIGGFAIVGMFTVLQWVFG